ncbi:TPA: sigma-54-dependent Fis family transcriptional regulator, partial [Candidatus Azambacteria bacterium]|nr:sigma-54-dependent Fis family transcriptional regulator [Candidatus Azambacteria bacterium]
APANAAVLITGPNGAGKEGIANVLHANSPRKNKPFIKVNMGALPGDLMEAELFGAEAGAYSGASKTRIGRFEAADGGTLFLD